MSDLRLWILRPVQEGEWGPWDPWYDKAFGFVVRAATEAEARQMADAEAGEENVPAYALNADRTRQNNTNAERVPESWDHPWLHSELSTCEPLTPDGEPGIVIRDFARA